MTRTCDFLPTRVVTRAQYEEGYVIHIKQYVTGKTAMVHRNYVMVGISPHNSNHIIVLEPNIYKVLCKEFGHGYRFF